MELIEKLESVLAKARVEAESFYNKGNKSAGTRLRKDMQELKTIAQEVRNNVTETKNAE